MYAAPYVTPAHLPKNSLHIVEPLSRSTPEMRTCRYISNKDTCSFPDNRSCMQQTPEIKTPGRFLLSYWHLDFSVVLCANMRAVERGCCRLKSQVGQ